MTDIEPGAASPAVAIDRRFVTWWMLSAAVYGTSVMWAAIRNDAHPVALVAFGVTVIPFGLLVAFDITVHQLPRVVSYVTLAVSLPLLTLASRGDAAFERWSAAQGAALMVAITATIRVIGRRSLGRGDVHFSPPLGAVLGWFQPELALTAWAIIAVVGGIAAALRLRRGFDRSSRMPYGPYMLLGTSITLAVFA